MDAKVENLKQFAQSGNIDGLYTLIREDVNLLEHIDGLPFADTPLHVAASAGQISFAVEMMGLKPSFARKLDPDGFSPIHLALQKGHIELVRRLLKVDRDLVRVRGKEQLTLLHYIVDRGEHLDLLDEFLLFCPNSITDVTVQSETALHIALKYNRFEAFQFFVGWLANNSSEIEESDIRTVLNWKNNEGNTVLHILVLAYETEAVTHLLSWCKEFVDVNQKNLHEETAWDILQEAYNSEIRVMLSCAGAKPGSSLSTSSKYPNPEYQRPATFSCVDFLWPKTVRRQITKLSEEKRNTLLLVTVLVATLSFQAVLTPPGGIWPDNGLCNTTEAGSSFYQIPPFNKTVGSTSNYPKIIYLSQSNTTLACVHKAGTAIASEYRIFWSVFLVINTALFSLSNSLIVVLILHLYIRFLFLLLSIFLCLTYFLTVWTITDNPVVMIPLVSIASIYFVLIQLLSWK